MQAAKVRLFVEHPLGAGQPVPLSRDQAHYLFNVMRLGPGAGVLLFNGRDGEWQAEVAAAGRQGGVLIAAAQTRPVQPPPDLWLMFAPLKKARTDFIVEKAVELGVARVLPVQTAHTRAERLRQDRMQAHAVEAAEQCGATVVPEVAALAPLERVLAAWPPDRRILWCDEGLAQRGGGAWQAGERGAAGAVLVGPEGGFSEAERRRLAAMPQALPVRLGPRILRADTAAVAALTLWQMHCGDWSGDGA